MKAQVNIEGKFDPYVLDCFFEALSAYPALQKQPLCLRMHPLQDMTMRAQPVVNLHFFSRRKRAYRIDVQHTTRVNRHIVLEDLDRDVLVGWFAHELGHVRDYYHRSGLNLIFFGLGYWLLPTFRIGAERKADLYAIEHGFATEINATKRFLLEESDIPNSYKDRLNRYYMSIEEVERVVLERTDGKHHWRDRVLGGN